MIYYNKEDTTMAEITNVSFRPYKQKGNNLKGFAQVTLDDELVLTGIKLVKGGRGLFISMPAEYWPSDEEYHDIFFPITKELRAAMQEAVIEAYENYDEDAEKAKRKKGKKAPAKKKADDDEEDD